MKGIPMTLIVGNASKSDVRRGWVRLSFKNRKNNIKRERVYKINNGEATVFRIVLGNDRVESENHILIDKYTRDELEVDLDVEYSFQFNKVSIFERLFCFYWNHPDYTFRAGYQLAWILGGLGILFSLIGILF